MVYSRVNSNQSAYPITRRHILDSSKLKEFADDNFKFDEYGKKLSKRVENTVGKGEIARYEQFLLFPPCFQKACFPGASKGVIVWEWVTLCKLTRVNRSTFYLYWSTLCQRTSLSLVQQVVGENRDFTNGGYESPNIR